MLNKKSVKSGTAKFFRKQGTILGVKITGTPKKSLLTQIDDYLSKNRQYEAKKPLFITTPNPEQVVLAQKDRKFKEILENADISLIDGVGLLVAHEYNNKPKIQKSKDGNVGYSGKHPLGGIHIKNTNKDSSRRVDRSGPIGVIFTKIFSFVTSYYSVLKTGISSDGLKVIKGRDLFLDLLKLADDKRYKVFLLGSTRRVLKRTVTQISQKYPSVRLKTYHGAKLDSNSVPLDDKQIRSDEKSVRLINRFQPDILFVAYGAPKQEKWVYRNINNLKTGIVMVVGSSFDYLAGTRKPVPQPIENMGLEWLWRLLTGSQNMKRIFNAVIKFPYLVVTDVSS